MRMDHESSLTPRWIVFGTALVYFSLGSLLTAHFMHLKEAWADSHRVFQLEIHHAVPGKIPGLKERFRRDRQEAKSHWKTFHPDPTFQQYADSEVRPTDYSSTK